jgi:hypothetical protein
MPRKHETEEDILDALEAIYRVVYRLGMAVGGRKVTNENYEQVYRAFFRMMLALSMSSFFGPQI